MFHALFAPSRQGRLLGTARVIVHRMTHTTLQAAGMRAPVPKHLGLELTSHCNLRCNMCALHSADAKSRADRRPVGHMDLALFERVVTEAAQLRPRLHVGLNFGGETLLYPHLDRVLEILQKLGLSGRAGFNTNATLLSGPVADMLLECFRGHISVSLDGFEQSHESIRTGCVYQRVHDNLLTFLGRRRNGVPRVSVNLTRVSQPPEEIERFVDYWASRLDYVCVSQQFTRANRFVTTDERLERVLARGRRLCRWPWCYMAVLWDGRIVLCCHDIAGLGAGIHANVRDQSLREIWTGPEFREIRERFLRGDYAPFEACRSCETWAEQYVREKFRSGRYFVRTTGLSTNYRLER